MSDLEQAVCKGKRLSINKILRRLCPRVRDRNFQCYVCKKEFKLAPGRYNNLARHIAKLHPYHYTKLVKDYRIKTLRPRNIVNKPKPQRFRSWVRKYCEKVGEKVYRCNLCSKKLSMHSGILGNMRRHIKLLHKNVYYKEINKDDNEISTEENIDNSDIIEYIVEYVDTDNLNNSESVDETIEKSPLSEVEKDEEMKENTLMQQDLVSNLGEQETNPVEEIIINLISSSDPELENKIKNICDTPAEGRRSSCIWKFFKAIAPGRLYACVFCGLDLTSAYGGSGNLRRHLTRHKKPYELILKYEKKSAVKEIKPNESTDVSNSDTETSEKENFDVEHNFICKICDVVIPYGEDKDAVVKHILDKHPDQEIVNHGDEIADEETE